MYGRGHGIDCVLRGQACFAAFPRFLYFAKQEKLSPETYKLPDGCHTDAEKPIQLHITLLHKGENRKPKPGATPRPHLARQQVRTGFLLNQTIPQKFPLVEHTSERPHCIEKISTSPGGFGSYVSTEKRQCRSHRSAVLSKILLFCHLFFSALLFTKKRTPHRMPRLFASLYTTGNGQRPPQKKNHSHTSRFPQ